MSGEEAEVSGLRVEPGVAVGQVGGVQAERGALVVVVLVDGPGRAASDDHGAKGRDKMKEFVCSKIFVACSRLTYFPRLS